MTRQTVQQNESSAGRTYTPLHVSVPRDFKAAYRRSSNRIVIFIGAPGCGKGTQSSLLASRLGIPAISTGAILREEAKKDSHAGIRLRRILATGALVDDATVCETVVARIADSQRSDSPGNLILDGFPRTVGQARKLDDLLGKLGMPGPLVIHLDVPNDVLMRRLSRRRQCATCGATAEAAPGITRCRIDGGLLEERDDDREGVVARRLAAYERETLPVIEYYRNRADSGVYRRLDGDLGTADIAKDVCDIVSFADTALAA